MSNRRLSPAGSLAVAALAMSGSTALAAQPPQVLNPGTYANLVRFTDGSIKRVRASNGYLRSQTSLDHGLTWSSEVAEFSLAGSTNPVPVIDLSNQLHYVRFLVRDETNGGTRIPNVNYFRDIWHYTAHDGVNWTANMAQAAHTGSIMDAISLIRGSARGRLIVPYGDAFVGSSGGYGNNFTKIIYADDAGRTWHASPSQLKSPVPADWNGSPDGACEPSIAELGDGQLWMLMRTQAGALYESRSDDAGVTWSEARPSLFYSSTGPPNFLRLDDGRLMLFWNNATMPPRYNGSIVYAGRDALHAAISEDDGKTWKGFREVYLDPYRNENPISGDSGTAYPFPAATADGRALVIAGQAQARAMLRIDPDWLLETSRSSDFANGLADWSVFKPYGRVINVKRNRKVGPQLVFDPQENKQVMHLRRPDSDDPDGAAWNFPMAKRGQTQLRLKIVAGFGGGVISLGDRFFEPTDAQGQANAIFQISISADGALPGGTVLQPSRWYTLELDWDLAQHRATLLLDGQTLTQLQQRTQARPGPSYLRLRSTATGLDTAGFFVSSVSQIGLPTGAVRESAHLSPGDASAALSGADSHWTTFRFDDYVPNTNATASGNGGTGTFAGSFTGLIRPQTAAPPVGILVESSAGTVSFIDATSTQVTSDLLGPKNGGSLTITFVDVSDPTKKAAVSGFAFRYGSTIADNVDVTVFDLDGHEMPDYAVRMLDETLLGASAGMIGFEDLARAPTIHRIVFTASGNDTWLLGSFALDPSLADFAFTDFTIVPEPLVPTMLLVLSGVGAVRRRKL